ncbi:MAG: methyltransferase type 12, partial [Bryobacteraceae bacterium]
AAHLALGGAIVVLGPAHPFLFGRFDTAVGHYRRYTKRALRSVAPAGLIEREVAYLDSAGLIASACAAVLRQYLPTQWQILFWDRLLIRLSQILDPVLCGTTGKSILGIWTAGGAA